MQVINRVIEAGDKAKWGSPPEGGGGDTAAAQGPERWVQFGAFFNARLAVDQPGAAAGAVSAASRRLADYLALPLDQYALLDPRWISRDPGGGFRFSVPLQDLVSVDLQPEICIRWGPCGVGHVGRRAGRQATKAWDPGMGFRRGATPNRACPMSVPLRRAFPQRDAGASGAAGHAAGHACGAGIT